MIDFGPRRWWDEEKTQIRYVRAYCRACSNMESRESHAHMTPVQRKRKRASNRVWYRRDRRRRGVKEIGPRVTGHKQNHTVEREPFVKWLVGKIEQYNMAYVARRTQMDERQIRTLVNGYTTNGTRKMSSNSKRKLSAIDYVGFDVVDQALLNWGEHHILNQLYPPPPEPVIEVVVPPPPPPPKWDDIDDLIANAAMIGTNKNVPDVIGEWQRRLKAGKRR